MMKYIKTETHKLTLRLVLPRSHFPLPFASWSHAAPLPRPLHVEPHCYMGWLSSQKELHAAGPCSSPLFDLGSNFLKEERLILLEAQSCTFLLFDLLIIFLVVFLFLRFRLLFGAFFLGITLVWLVLRGDTTYSACCAARFWKLPEIWLRCELQQSFALPLEVAIPLPDIGTECLCETAEAVTVTSGILAALASSPVHQLARLNRPRKNVKTSADFGLQSLKEFWRLQTIPFHGFLCNSVRTCEPFIETGLKALSRLSREFCRSWNDDTAKPYNSSSHGRFSERCVKFSEVHCTMLSGATSASSSLTG